MDIFLIIIEAKSMGHNKCEDSLLHKIFNLWLYKWMVILLKETYACRWHACFVTYCQNDVRWGDQQWDVDELIQSSNKTINREITLCGDVVVRVNLLHSVTLLV